MTFTTACNFAWMAIELREILYAILTNNYVKSKITFAADHFVWFLYNFFKFLLINYMCETVTIKANAIAELLNRLSYFTCDVELREIVSQFLLQVVHAPVRFCGFGFFQFGYKFLYRLVMSIATVLVIIIQAYVSEKYYYQEKNSSKIG
ncbi:uncharacterized protein LOC105198416 [Solenopsis invicta]|uniref:uncharacterized protein LOC105198416 n=1 Tax=Solenopsis invicta TaxID=13686 RepID=UPI00193D3B7C|nr:uncharacterized protein LOC105198416 [Solenopsis invicta]